MEEMKLTLERHEERLRTLARDISDLKAVQSEIRIMNESLITLATELKHTNEHLRMNEKKLQEMEMAPHKRLQQLITAAIAAAAGALVSMLFGLLF